MTDISEIYETIYEAIDEFHASKGEGVLEKSPETALFGAGSVLDSMGLVNLIVTIEQSLEDKLDVVITLTDERAVSRKNSPFRTVEALAQYIHLLMKEQPDG